MSRYGSSGAKPVPTVMGWPCAESSSTFEQFDSYVLKIVVQKRRIADGEPKRVLRLCSLTLSRHPVCSIPDGVCVRGAAQAIEKEGKREVDEAVDAAKNSAQPEENMLYAHIHSGTPDNFEVRAPPHPASHARLHLRPVRPSPSAKRAPGLVAGTFAGRCGQLSLSGQAARSVLYVFLIQLVVDLVSTVGKLDMSTWKAPKSRSRDEVLIVEFAVLARWLSLQL